MVIPGTCPVCESHPLPVQPSYGLKLKIMQYQNAIDVYGSSKSVPWFSHSLAIGPSDVCNAIKVGITNEAIIESGQAAGWPTSFDWFSLPGKVFEHQDNLKEIFYNRVVLEASPFWKSLKSCGLHKKTNSVRIKADVMMYSRPG